LYDYQLIEQETADSRCDEQAELDQRGGELGQCDDLTAYDAGHSNGCKPTETFCNRGYRNRVVRATI